MWSCLFRTVIGAQKTERLREGQNKCEEEDNEKEDFLFHVYLTSLIKHDNKSVGHFWRAYILSQSLGSILQRLV